jgi:4-amino-4-deoxy-L-arabinose transferase-like glycosyltransferase
VQLSEGITAVRSRLAKASWSGDAFALVGVVAAALLLLLIGLGNRDFWPPDEPRYGAIAEELRSFAHGWRGLVLLHLNGQVYTQKPPLFFWLAALAGAPVGHVSEAAARLPSALAGFATLLSVGWLGRSMFGARSGTLAALVLLTVPSWLQLATSARLDALLTAFVTLAFVAAWRIDRGSGAAGRNRAVLHAAIGLGVLTKGPVAMLVPALGITAYLAWERRLGDLRRFATPCSVLLSVAPGVLWLGAATLLAPAGWADASFWDNVILRFFSGTAHVRPVWFYVEALPRSFLPWTLLWPAAWWRQRSLQRDARNRTEARAWRFLLASIGATFALFSLSAGKRGVYLLPIHPLIAIVCGDTLAAWLRAGEAAPRWLRRSVSAASAALIPLGVASLAAGRVAEVELSPALGLLLGAGGAAAWSIERELGAHAGQRAAALAAIATLLVAVGAAYHAGVAPALNGRNSQREVAELARTGTPIGETIGVYRNDTLAGAVAYYARRPVRELNDLPEVAAFLAGGGRTLIVEDDHLSVIAARAPFVELGRGRARQRRFHVLRPAPAARLPPGRR